MNKIAVLDDDEIIREVVRGMLAKHDYDVSLYETKEALFADRSALETTDLLLLDIYLEDANGIDILREIKSDARYSSLPVVMITSDSSDSTLEKCFLSGAFDYITKPFQELTLKARVQAAIEQAYRFKRLEAEIVYFRAQSQTIYDKNQEYKERIRTLEMFHEELSSTTQHLAAATWRERQRRDELNAALEELRATQAKAEQSRKKIIDSINYARKIQSAFLPTSERMTEIFPSSFVIYLPKDIVSGDFYWCWENGSMQLIGAFDCTGHGVPGAFMSLIGMSLLNEIVQMQKGCHLNEILKSLHNGVYQLLNQHRAENQDGMDAAICCIDTRQKVLKFSGAGNPLVYFRNGECRIIKGTKLSIGGKRLNGRNDFELHELDLEGIQEIYLFSDGLQDQFGGAKAQKLGIRNITNLLSAIHHDPMSEQEQKIRTCLHDWMNAGPTSQKQIDDILFMGVRL